MFNRFITRGKQHIANIPGWRTDRKIVVFESDDWGAIRMPSKNAYQSLLKSGIRVDKSLYDRFDTLERKVDIETLYETLLKFKDLKGNYPIITFNTVMGNPDFEKIKEDHYENFHHENLFNSYLRYHEEDLSDLWEIGINKRLIKPQFHAKEHINVSLWLKALKQNHQETKKAFEYHFYGLKTDTPSVNQQDYLAAYWVEGESDLKEKEQLIEEGLREFEKTFRFKSESFIACNHVFPIKLENVLNENGVRFIQGQRGYLSPNIQTGRKQFKRIYTGKLNQSQQTYLVRNCSLEPSLDHNRDWLDTCLKDIKVSFKWKKPAIISTHRINYVSGLEIKNRDRGIGQLDHLLTNILKNWPEVEFMTSDQLGRLIKG